MSCSFSAAKLFINSRGIADDKFLFTYLHVSASVCLYCDSVISVHKKGGNHGNSLSFFTLLFVIYLLNVFWGFGSFTVVDSPSYNKNMIYLFIVFCPPWTSEHWPVPRLPMCKSGPASSYWSSEHQYGLQTASTDRLVGELLWLPSASTSTSLWLGSEGCRRAEPVEALVQGGKMRGGERSPPPPPAGIMENW